LSAPDIHLPTSTTEDEWVPTLLGRGISSVQAKNCDKGQALHLQIETFILRSFQSLFLFLLSFVWVGDGSIERAHCEKRGGKKKRELERKTKLV
jgi:hypothetical protein